jgi:hypothetical protein
MSPVVSRAELHYYYYASVVSLTCTFITLFNSYRLTKSSVDSQQVSRAYV